VRAENGPVSDAHTNVSGPPAGGSDRPGTSHHVVTDRPDELADACAAHRAESAHYLSYSQYQSEEQPMTESAIPHRPAPLLSAEPTASSSAAARGHRADRHHPVVNHGVPPTW